MKFQDRYTKLDRILHRLAFSTIELQKALADVEDRIYAGRLGSVGTDRPVFITALPRAGTTLLLETLGSLETFVTHTYRNMPFLLIPLLWNVLSDPFRAPNVVFDRAHGDGMTVGYDSPEAFEEVLWHTFWPDKYLGDRILPWTEADEDTYGEFASFFKTHIAKLASLRAGREPEAVRYLSKNNANLSRIQKIVRVFPDAVVLVPFRNPLDHAASMLHQHRNFLSIHAAEPFTRRYMEDIGHFEFGANLRPIDFDRWLSREDPKLTLTADFWLKYWCTAYAHVLTNLGRNVMLVSYDALYADPATSLRRIGEAIGVDEATSLVSAADRFRTPTAYDAADLNVDAKLLDSVSALHQELLARSIGAR